MSILPSHAVYLGDGLYGWINEFGQVVLASYNGVEIGNIVFLEPETLQSFKRFIAKAEATV
jgi:hypothetical protein